MSAIDNRLLRNPPLLGAFSTLETTCLPFAPLPSRRRTSDKAVVTWVAGERAYQWFSVTGPAMQRYATRVDADLVVLDGFGGQPYVLANKFRVKQVFTEYGYDRVLYIDADALSRITASTFSASSPPITLASSMRGRSTTSGRWRSTAVKPYPWRSHRAAR